MFKTNWTLISNLMSNGHSTTRSYGRVSMVQEPKATKIKNLVHRHFILSAGKDPGIS